MSLFPGGGLQRDCTVVAHNLRASGHDVTIFCARGMGELPIKILPNGAWTNHGRNRIFAARLAEIVRGNFDLVVGFDKLPGLDVLYCGDPPVGHRHAAGQALRPRYRTLRGLEGACFAPGRATHLILLSEQQVEDYRRIWSTEPARISLLPPTLDRNRRRPNHRTNGVRTSMRAAMGLADGNWAWLAIGVYPRTKGFDRTLAALPRFPQARVLLVGTSETAPRARRFSRLAQELGVADRLIWLGSREDVPELMSAADVLVHPARQETTGTVILEALVNGLPVVTSSTCGYARHVSTAQAGLVVDEPFDHDRFVAALGEAADPQLLARWSANAARYGEDPELYRGLGRATDIIMDAATRRTRATP